VGRVRIDLFRLRVMVAQNIDIPKLHGGQGSCVVMHASLQVWVSVEKISNRSVSVEKISNRSVSG
jgi:hypothetical protein